jgi:hypothetical protein
VLRACKFQPQVWPRRALQLAADQLSRIVRSCYAEVVATNVGAAAGRIDEVLENILTCPVERTFHAGKFSLRIHGADVRTNSAFDGRSGIVADSAAELLSRGGA